MKTKLFIVEVETADHDDDLFDHFAKHVAHRFAGSAYHITDVRELIIEPTKET